MSEWFTVRLTINSLFPYRWLPSLISMICLRIAVRPLLLTRAFALDELLGAGLAVLIWVLLREKTRPQAGLGMLAVAIALPQLGLFHFSHLPANFGPAGAMFWKDSITVSWCGCCANRACLA